MSADAIVMMVVAMTILWGGLALALVHLSRRSGPEAPIGPVSTHRDL